MSKYWSIYLLTTGLLAASLSYSAVFTVYNKSSKKITYGYTQTDIFQAKSDLSVDIEPGQSARIDSGFAKPMIRWQAAWQQTLPRTKVQNCQGYVQPILSGVNAANLGGTVNIYDNGEYDQSFGGDGSLGRTPPFVGPNATGTCK